MAPRVLLWLGMAIFFGMVGCSHDNQSTGGEGGGGAANVECLTPSQCPGEDNDCVSRRCEAGRCGLSIRDVPVKSQVDGDCLKRQCDGGSVVEVADDDPIDDGNECTVDACSDGAPTHLPVDERTPCGLGVGTHCNGAGECVGCTGDSECPADTECADWSCTEQKCVSTPAAQGTICGDTVHCENGVVTLADTCNGRGSCGDGGTLSCAPYACDERRLACRTDCFENDECCCQNECFIPGVQGFGECIAPP